jgi:protein TonB
MSSLAHSINSTDRLGMMLLVAVIIHALFILGVVFDLNPPTQENSEKALDIIVIRNPKPEANDSKADFLAEQSQKGGGELEEKKRVTAEPANPTLKPKPQKQAEALPTPPAQSAPEKKVLVQQQAQQKKPVITPKPKIENKPKKISMDQLLASTQSEIDLLTAEIDQRKQTQSKQPRRKYINSSTQEYKYAAYLSAWRKKVEDIGNLNYPDEAKKKKIYGNILMTVVLKPDGKVSSINIRHSSGHQLLDDAAIRIVNLASPFAPFPDNIRAETDELVITRTWQFVSGNKLFSD